MSNCMIELPKVPGPLIDTFGRRHNNLRISVTDRCNLRCSYCMTEDEKFMDGREFLTFEEIAHFVEAVIPLGIDKVRLTGGEPLLRRDLAGLVARLSRLGGIKDLGLTTNGLLLAGAAQPLYDAGMRRINISLDTLNPARFRQLARRDGLDKVLAGIEAARKAGFEPIKLNAISIRGFTESEVVPLARFARDRGLEMRFIEYMPIGSEPWERSKVYFAHEIVEQIQNSIGPLIGVDDPTGHDPAMVYRYADGQDQVGIIASVSRPFCTKCNRLRLTADGKLRNCLFALDEADIKTLLRNGASDEDIRDVVRQNIHAKWEGHEINTSRFIKPERTMHSIGG
jgi:cyclic pyranopterin phosphate synthase